jgi:hypothetical protein
MTKDLFKETDNPNLTTAWKVQSSLLQNQMPSYEQASSVSSFFMCRWLSNNKVSIPIAAVINRDYNTPEAVQYLFANDYIELTSMRKKVKFISFSKDKINPMMKKILDNIQRYYNVNQNQSVEYFNLMNDEQKDRLMDMYNEGIQK